MPLRALRTAPASCPDASHVATYLSTTCTGPRIFRTAAGRAGALLNQLQNANTHPVNTHVSLNGMHWPPNPQDGCSPLLAAAAGGHADVCKLLLAAGADKEARDPVGGEDLRRLA